MQPKICIFDSTLRDGSHAIGHRITKEQIRAYASAADAARMDTVVVGHGNGLGASSLQVGLSLLSDSEMLETAKACLSFSKLGVYTIPGFATIKRDLAPALDAGVDLVCVGCHCTEADMTQRHIEYVREHDGSVYGNLMMTHMVSKDVLVEQCLKMQSYGAEGVILMDSAGNYLPEDVEEKVSALVAALTIAVGFHAHNNLGLAVANSLTAVKAGATILDACARGCGAGAGNAALEVVVAVLRRMNVDIGIDFYKVLDASTIAGEVLTDALPEIRPVNIVSGLAGVFSGFVRHVERISRQYGVDERDVFFELGRRHVVAGQEDLIIEVVRGMLEKGNMAQEHDT